MLNNQDYVTTMEAAQLLGLSKATIVQKINKGHFPGAVSCLCGRSLNIPRASLYAQTIPPRRKRRKGTLDAT